MPAAPKSVQEAARAASGRESGRPVFHPFTTDVTGSTPCARRSRQLKPSFNKSVQNCRWRLKKALRATEVARENGRAASWQSSRQNLTPPRRAAEIREPGLLADIGAFWHQFFARAFDPYRPELHYMRGPGPPGAPSMANASLQSSTPNPRCHHGRRLPGPPRAFEARALARARRRATMALPRRLDLPPSSSP